MPKKIWIPAVLALLVVGYAWHGPYVYPTALALGPCHYDWTSPTTWSGLLGGRASPLAQHDFTVGAADVRLCYGSPRARGRKLLPHDTTGTPVGRSGALIPTGRYWRLGANEPTRLFTNGPLQLGEVSLPAGRYALYAVPDTSHWQLVVNASVFHWGNDFSTGVTAQELARFPVPLAEADAYEEAFSVRAAPVSDAAARLVVAWGRHRLAVPVRAGP